MYDFECKVCRDKGRIGGCPSCGKQKGFLANEQDGNITRKDLNDLSIPLHYYNNRWDKNILINDKYEYADDQHFMNYIQQLDTCYKIIDEGGLPKISALVCAPQVYGKTTWANNCLIRAKERGYKVPPIIDTMQIRRMSLLNTEKPNKDNKYLGYSFNQYIESDLMVLMVTRSSEFVYAYETIVNILDIRSRMSKPTLIISDRSLRELSSFDKNRQLLNLTNGGTNVDAYRYAVLIEFAPYNL